MDELAYIRAADKAGFKYSWASEHHFLTDYSHLSANESFLAFAAAQTKNIHLGSGIINLTPPVNHPARIAERVAMLDHLSEGRFEFGHRSGLVDHRAAGLRHRGPGADPGDGGRDAARRSCGCGRRRTTPTTASSSPCPSATSCPSRTPSPHPPLWVAAGSPGTFELAARQGLGVLCFAFGKPEGFIPLIEKYKKDIKNAEPSVATSTTTS
jgi:alkanesulfonate monooxygenase SsuD/methylene tetrahydromethanopterin reductase-like flavin-dependent oxidoreductase (luciferase family)